MTVIFISWYLPHYIQPTCIPLLPSATLQNSLHTAFYLRLDIFLQRNVLKCILLARNITIPNTLQHNTKYFSRVSLSCWTCNKLLFPLLIDPENSTKSLKDFCCRRWHADSKFIYKELLKLNNKKTIPPNPAAKKKSKIL